MRIFWLYCVHIVYYLADIDLWMNKWSNINKCFFVLHFDFSCLCVCEYVCACINMYIYIYVSVFVCVCVLLLGPMNYVSSWYNRNGWLGIKKQLRTYLPTYLPAFIPPDWFQTDKGKRPTRHRWPHRGNAHSEPLLKKLILSIDRWARL